MSESFELLPDDSGGLTFRLAGEETQNVRIRRAFPWSKANEFISIRSSDGKELLLIESLAGLDANLRALIEQHLAQTIFIPTIKRVEEIDVRFGFQEWRVQTDRGP